MNTLKNGTKNQRDRARWMAKARGPNPVVVIVCVAAFVLTLTGLFNYWLFF